MNKDLVDSEFNLLYNNGFLCHFIKYGAIFGFDGNERRGIGIGFFKDKLSLLVERSVVLSDCSVNFLKSEIL